ncbi:MAG: (2Fe-2S)-binding protein [Candidatus Brocadiia bacterium]
MRCCSKAGPKSRQDPIKAPDKTIICWCNKVTKGEIIDAIRKGSRTLEDIKKATGANAGNKCKTTNPKGICCAGDIKILLEYWVSRMAE